MATRPCTARSATARQATDSATTLAVATGTITAVFAAGDYVYWGVRGEGGVTGEVYRVRVR